MDLLSLMQACVDGLASGSLSAFGSALGAATVTLFKKLAGRKEDMDESELKAMGSLADPEKLAQEAARLANEDSDFDELLAKWCDLMEKHLEGTRESKNASNSASGVFFNSPVSQTNIVR
ncbi:hypothetical protein C1878_03785 [Gordonibacter sp. 28C]|uniref:hypothetical protein n=1 Tax=Gordonibacter sp. 28C TaxID=2078569 RepID=UPI000DF86910|nr:hypothetical protein [Gordonibacter sp. 28C]RDB63918.1 hypothetical protein C1878_03785 [Gordonibacter sp. 28C]